jgi:L,D-transpeptidase catalytic domain
MQSHTTPALTPTATTTPVAALTAIKSIPIAMPAPVGLATPVATIPTPAVAPPGAPPGNPSPAAPTVASAPRPSDAIAKPAGSLPPRAVTKPVASYTHSINHVFYGRPAMQSHTTPALTPTATTTPVAALTAIKSIPIAMPAPVGLATPVTTIPAPAIAIPAPAAVPTAIATPTAIAKIVPPAPPTSAPVSAASPSTVSADHTAEGLRLFLSDSASATSNPLNWSVTAIKSHHEIEVSYKGRPYKTFHAVFGRSRFGGPKQWEGDRRTPEGNYLIVSKHRSARFRWFLKINYPNAVDQANFTYSQADGDIPRGMREGGSVGIHGTDLPILNIGNIDWTTGCVSIDNADISELARLLPIGTLVVIKP